MLTQTMPLAVPPEAVADLAENLAIGNGADTGLLTAALASAIRLCESFVGQHLLARDWAETLDAHGGWQRLAARPVTALIGVEGLPAQGAPFALDTDAYAFERLADGGARLRIARPGPAGRVRVTCTAGLAHDWAGVHDSLRHGVIRLAAHDYLHRDRAEELAMPGAIAALWRPFRRMGLA